jgi:UDP-arabinose 4-epimerase
MDACRGGARRIGCARMAVLITGGAGYIGSHTAMAVAEAGFEPVVLDNLVQGQREAVRWGPFEQGDLLDASFLTNVFEKYDVEAVVHFAAHTSVAESVLDPEKYLRNNVHGTRALLEAMAKARVGTIVFSSSAAVYGAPEKVPIPETHPLRPTNPYGESKLSAENVVRRFGEAHGIRWAALRYFNAAGADPSGRLGERHDPETHLIPLCICSALGRREALDIFGTDYPTPDGTAIRDYVHVADLAQAHVRALRHLAGGGDNLTLNLGTSRGHSVREVVGAVETVSGRRVAVRHCPRRAGDPPTLVADAHAVEQKLGWKPAYPDLNTIVDHALSWQRRA